MEWMVMPLKKYAQFSGRSRRKEYWMYALGLVIAYLVFIVIAAAVVGGSFGAMQARSGAGVAGMFASLGVLAILYFVFALAILIPSLAVTVRRLHDTDRSGKWLLGYVGLYVLSVLVSIAGANGSSIMAVLSVVLSLAVLVYAIALFVFMCLDGTRGPNRYGPDPKGGAPLAEVFS